MARERHIEGCAVRQSALIQYTSHRV